MNYAALAIVILAVALVAAVLTAIWLWNKLREERELNAGEEDDLSFSLKRTRKLLEGERTNSKKLKAELTQQATDSTKSADQRVAECREQVKKLIKEKVERKRKQATEMFNGKKYRQALSLFDQTLGMASLLGDKVLTTGLRHSIAVCRCKLGHHNDAKVLFEQVILEAQSLYKPGEQPLKQYVENLSACQRDCYRDESQRLVSKGQDLYNRDDFDGSIKVFEQAAAVAEKGQSAELQTFALREMADSYRVQSQFATAAAILEKALVIAKRDCPDNDELQDTIMLKLVAMQDEVELVDCRKLYDQAKEQLKAGDHYGAEDSAQEAIDLCLSKPCVGKTHWLTGFAHDRLGAALFGLGRYRDALSALQTAEKILLEWNEKYPNALDGVRTRIQRCQENLGY